MHDFWPEGRRYATQENQHFLSSRAGLEAAWRQQIILEGLALRCDPTHALTVQLGDTGLIPGSGVGNHRKAIDKTTLGVPVVAVGVPTVIAAHLLGDGQPEDDPLFLTPRDIDGKVRELGRVIGYGVTLALQEGLSVEDVTGLLG